MNAHFPAPVLVVKDDTDIRDALRAVLEEATYTVGEAAIIGEAVDYRRLSGGRREALWRGPPAQGGGRGGHASAVATGVRIVAFHRRSL
ncbi:MAG TPA: hypothetical protein VGP82_06510 [Ktedonobacterales bacterium]|nr:hypothetical protein [Ktedonobacterales bacterium]